MIGCAVCGVDHCHCCNALQDHGLSRSSVTICLVSIGPYFNQNPNRREYSFMQSSQGTSLPNARALGVQYLIISHEDSSSATTSNLLGPSRTIGKLFSLWGAAVERHIGLLADRLGYGPLAYRRKLLKKYKYYLPWTLEEMTAKQRKGIVQKLMKYVMYTQSCIYSCKCLTSFQTKLWDVCHSISSA